MKTEIKAQWTAALRGGEYSQTHATLRDENGFCCLGVLCDLHRKAVGGEWSEDGVYFASYDDSESEVLPVAVQKWAGLENGNPKAGEFTLAVWNDGFEETDEEENIDVIVVRPRTFAQIATLIDEHL